MRYCVLPLYWRHMWLQLSRSEAVMPRALPGRRAQYCPSRRREIETSASIMSIMTSWPLLNYARFTRNSLPVCPHEVTQIGVNQ